MDKYGYLAIAKVMEENEEITSDKRRDYVSAKKEYYRTILMLSDKVDRLTLEPNIELAISDLDIKNELATVTYSMLHLISVLASQAPVEEHETFNPFINTAEQFNSGVDDWSKDINVNLEAAMTSLKVQPDYLTYFGVECFVSALMNVDNPDVVIATYFNLMKYLEKFNYTTVNEINSIVVSNFS